MRTVGRVLVLIMVLFMIGSAAADAEAWNCENCGQQGNTGNFCSNCGAARPAAGWICPSCGQEGNTGNFCINCGAARAGGQEQNPSGQTAQVTVDEQLEQIPDETDRVKVCLQSVTASSYIENKTNPARWLPENAADGDESTCWQFSAKKGLKGKSWIELNIGPAQSVDEVWFKNGFWAVNDKGKDQYVINSRLKGIRIEFLYSGETEYRDAVEFTLKDESRKGWQECDVGHHDNVTAVRVAVLTIYQGSYYKNDVCLSEVMLVQHAPAESAKPAAASREATVYESRPEVTGCELLMKLATRSGPGTRFAEPGTFFGSNWKGQTVRVLKKCYNTVWWVQVEFSYGSYGKYRVWTGAKRVDVNLNLVREEGSLGDSDVGPTNQTYYGPGPGYAKAGFSITRNAEAIIWGRENGYVDIEYWYMDSDVNKSQRVWVPEEALIGVYWGVDHSGTK